MPSPWKLGDEDIPGTSSRASGGHDGAPAPSNPHGSVAERGGWVPPHITERVEWARRTAPLLTDAWLAQTANAYDVQARSEIDRARGLVLDRPYRHKRYARHQAQAMQWALHARALRELLMHRQAANAAKAEGQS